MKKGTLSNIILILMLVIGLSLLLYPSFSDWWNSRLQVDSIVKYAESVSHLNDDIYDSILQSAQEYNAKLLERSNAYILSEEQLQQYENELNFTGNGIMGYIEIPSIDVYLPIYHGTENDVLQVAIGHLNWTSLPVGGPSTHCVVSGHRGLPSSLLFTNLDKLVVGDYFYINVLDEVLTYEVDQIRIVEPTETKDLLIQEGKDLCTLVTCTPYGINSHRLLVRGHRVENMEQTQKVRVTADAVIVEKLVVAPFLLAPILVIVLISLVIPKRKNKGGTKSE